MSLQEFSYLTGSSLTTFKRDFNNAFKATPQRWPTKKRLELAHYQFIEKKMKPIDVCYEVGFENLSHFSYALKKTVWLYTHRIDYSKNFTIIRGLSGQSTEVNLIDNQYIKYIIIVRFFQSYAERNVQYSSC